MAALAASSVTVSEETRHYPASFGVRKRRGFGNKMLRGTPPVGNKLARMAFEGRIGIRKGW